MGVFLYHYASDTVNGFIYGFNLNIEYLKPLATRRDAWVHIFSLFNYVGIIWALIIMYGRIKLINSSKMKKILGFFFASILIFFYLGLNLYKIYVFKEYGMQKRGHNHTQMIKKETNGY